MEKKRRRSKEGVIEEKTGKGSTFKQEKEQSKQPAQMQAQPIRAEAKPAPKAQPVLNEKDKTILNNVEHIIWNPDLLKNLNASKTQQPNGYGKKKPS